jgi:hypothetical protein
MNLSVTTARFSDGGERCPPHSSQLRQKSSLQIPRRTAVYRTSPLAAPEGEGAPNNRRFAGRANLGRFIPSRLKAMDGGRKLYRKLVRQRHHAVRYLNYCAARYRQLVRGAPHPHRGWQATPKQSDHWAPKPSPTTPHHSRTVVRDVDVVVDVIGGDVHRRSYRVLKRGGYCCWSLGRAVRMGAGYDVKVMVPQVLSNPAALTEIVARIAAGELGACVERVRPIAEVKSCLRSSVGVCSACRRNE